MAKNTVELPQILHRKLRVKAALENRSMNDIVVGALQGYLHGFRLEPDMLEVEFDLDHSGHCHRPGGGCLPHGGLPQSVAFYLHW